MDGYRDRNNGDGHERNRLLEERVLTGRSFPADSQSAIERPETWAAIAKQSQIGNERQIQVNDTADEIKGDGADIPDKRREKLWSQKRH